MEIFSANGPCLFPYLLTNKTSQPEIDQSPYLLENSEVLWSPINDFRVYDLILD